jgi:hypothetical protein
VFKQRLVRIAVDVGARENDVLILDQDALSLNPVPADYEYRINPGIRSRRIQRGLDVRMRSTPAGSANALGRGIDRVGKQEMKPDEGDWTKHDECRESGVTIRDAKTRLQATRCPSRG